MEALTRRKLEPEYKSGQLPLQQPVYPGFVYRIIQPFVYCHERSSYSVKLQIKQDWKDLVNNVEMAKTVLQSMGTDVGLFFPIKSASHNAPV